MLYFWIASGATMSKIILASVQFTNTVIQTQIQIQIKIQIQKLKYSLWWSAKKTQHMPYFWIAGGSTMSKIILPSVQFTNTGMQRQIQIHNPGGSLLVIFLLGFGSFPKNYRIGL